jgi:hypothetical protein
MTQRQLVQAVAGATGESRRTIRTRGFGVLHARSRPATDDLQLVLDCPFCGHRVAFPGTLDGAMAECLICDLYFEALPGDVYLASIPERAAS